MNSKSITIKKDIEFLQLDEKFLNLKEYIRRNVHTFVK